MSERPQGFNSEVNFSRAIHLMHQIRRGGNSHSAEMLKAYDLVKKDKLASINIDPSTKYAFTIEALLYGIAENLADFNVASKIFWRAAGNDIRFEVEQFKIKASEELQRKKY